MREYATCPYCGAGMRSSDLNAHIISYHPVEERVPKSPEATSLGAYLGVLSRLESDIAPVDQITAATSIAISLKRIADALEKISGNESVNRYGENLSEAIQNSIARGLRGIHTGD